MLVFCISKGREELVKESAKNKQAEQKRTCILVLGMHRSGTSALTRVLNIAGAALPKRLMGGSDNSNVTGHWEPDALVQYHDHLLAELGSAWSDWRALDMNRLSAERTVAIKKEIQEIIIEDYGDAPLFALKDPRICRFAPLFIEVLNEININVSIVISFRNPLEVCESLEKRNNMSRADAALLWLRHVLDAEKTSRNYKRTFVEYDRFLKDWKGEFEKIQQQFNLSDISSIDEMEPQVTEFLSSDHRHHERQAKEVFENSLLQYWVGKAYDGLLLLSKDPNSKKAKSIFDNIAKNLNVSSSSLQILCTPDKQEEDKKRQEQISLLKKKEKKIINLDSALAEINKKSKKLEKAVNDYERKINELEQSNLVFENKIKELEQNIKKIGTEAQNSEKSLIKSQEQVETIKRDYLNSQEQVETLKQELQQTQEGLTSAREESEAYRNSTSWKVTKPFRMLKRPFKRKTFNAKWYLKQYPDVAEADFDPFEHFIQYGKAEGRKPVPDPFFTRIVNGAKLIYRVIPVAIKREGGIAKLFKTSFFVLKNEGLKGFKAKIIAVDNKLHDRNDYQEWVRRYDRLNDKNRNAMRNNIAKMKSSPLISIVLPVYNPKPSWLIEVIESVQKQIYTNWELCIADDASTDKSIAKILKDFEKNDSRIKVVFRKKNGHISAASNSALKIAAGDWVALLDHDDLLPEHALYWVADAINKNPDIKLIYSDEDKIDEQGNRKDPYFKCDWNPDLFYSHNMFCHLGVYNHSLLKSIKGFRVGMEGSQDYDLALRCIEKIDREQIHHIPRVLYHWRVHDKSTAQSGNAKPYAMIAGERALNEHFKRTGIKATSKLTGHCYRTLYKLPKKLPLVSLIIPTKNGLRFVQQCIESIIKKTTYKNYEIILVDNNSDDPDVITYFKKLAKNPKIRVIKDKRPFNFSALNNAAVETAKGEIIGLINNDIEVISPEWLGEMVSHVTRPEVGVVGAKLYYPNNTLQHGGVVLGIGGWAGHSHKGFPRSSFGYLTRTVIISEFSAVTAACFLIRKSIYEKVGGLNEKDLAIAFNDVDFCLKVKQAGYRNIFTPYAELYHHESVTRGYEDTPEKQARFAKEVHYMKETWGDILLNDPAYSPNLTLDHEDFSYAWPPRVEGAWKELQEIK